MKDGVRGERRIESPVPLLDGEGRLVSPGYATRMLFAYDRKRVRCGPLSLKEWDFYQIASGEYIVQLVVGHVSYMASFSATIFSIKTGERRSVSRMKLLPFKSLPMPVDPEAPNTLAVELKDFSIRFETTKDRRLLTLKARDRKSGIADIELKLDNDKDNDKMVIATSFSHPLRFYLNEKENFYRVRGRAVIGDLSVEFTESDTALLDWGRGVWPYKHEWFWGNGSGFVEGGRFGFNIGWGFGDTSLATENMVFWNGKATKIGTLRVERNPDDYMADWRFRDEAGSFDFTMRPLFDNFTQTNLCIVKTRCHQVFGSFSGTAVCDDGRKIEVRDLTAFCEHAVNRW